MNFCRVQLPDSKTRRGEGHKGQFRQLQRRIAYLFFLQPAGQNHSLRTRRTFLHLHNLRPLQPRTETRRQRHRRRHHTSDLNCFASIWHHSFNSVSDHRSSASQRCHIAPSLGLLRHSSRRRRRSVVLAAVALIN